MSSNYPPSGQPNGPRVSRQHSSQPNGWAASGPHGWAQPQQPGQPGWTGPAQSQNLQQPWQTPPQIPKRPPFAPNQPPFAPVPPTAWIGQPGQQVGQPGAPSGPLQGQPVAYRPAPQPPRRSGSGKLVAAIVIAALVLSAGLVGGYLYAQRNTGNDEMGTDTVAATAPPSADAAGDAHSAPTVGTPPEGSVKQDQVAGEQDPGAQGDSGGTNSEGEVAKDAGERLAQIKDADKQFVQMNLEGYWVPQIGSKKVGMVADGKTWTDQDILDDYEAKQRQHPDAVLVWTGDYTSYKAGDYWAILIGISYVSKEGAWNWCETNGYSSENCYAKRLSTTGGPEGNTYMGD